MAAPPIDTDIRTLHKKKNQAYTDGNESLYRAAKYELRAAIRKAKSKYANTLEKQIASNDTKSVWKKLKIMTDYKKSTAPPAVTDQDLPDKLNNFYGRFEQSSTPYAPPSPLPAPPFHIHEEKVRASFSKNKKGKAAGPDGVSPTVLKHCASQLAPIYTIIFNHSLRQCIVPKCFKDSVITPVPKKQ
ncbi:hypothetical protein WMY93_008063 [Mugilogobius chulae]|uniref:Reverse transcriptase n=1 Tax=Mugilogobius chulae TaxID=88201 RepID=A0AAW0PNT8_9GOBI